MAQGKIVNVYSDKEKKELIFPATKIEAISNAEGTGLDTYLRNILYLGDGGPTLENGAPIDASTLQGHTFADLINKIYPVGSLFFSFTSTSPASLYGGNWTQLKQRFLFAADDNSIYKIDTNGGEFEHTLTVEEMPSHSHNFRKMDKQGTQKMYTWNNEAEVKVSDTGVANRVVNTGGDQPHNNMPPYVTVYMWKRIS